MLELGHYVCHERKSVSRPVSRFGSPYVRTHTGVVRDVFLQVQEGTVGYSGIVYAIVSHCQATRREKLYKSATDLLEARLWSPSSRLRR